MDKAREAAESRIANANRNRDTLGELPDLTVERALLATVAELHQLRAENMRLRSAAEAAAFALEQADVVMDAAAERGIGDWLPPGLPKDLWAEAHDAVVESREQLTTALDRDGEAGPVDEAWLLANGFVLHKDRATAIDAESMTVTAGDYFEHGHVSVYRFNGKFTAGIKPSSQVSVEASRSAVLALLAALEVR